MREELLNILKKHDLTYLDSGKIIDPNGNIIFSIPEPDPINLDDINAEMTMCKLAERGLEESLSGDTHLLIKWKTENPEPEKIYFCKFKSGGYGYAKHTGRYWSTELYGTTISKIEVTAFTILPYSPPS